jgi:nucleotide-binding universal stress UspA family protein
MYPHILLPTDGSEFSNKAIPQGIELAKSIGARGRRGMAALVVGSETHKVLTHGTIPTLVCR